MSRLDSVIRRLEAQRLCLDAAAERVRDRPGLILELGLGNGRTYDHLRERLPGRRILVLDRQMDAHPSCVPPAGDLVLGPIAETLPALALRHPGEVVLAHGDLGCGDPATDAALAALVAKALPALLAPGALVLSDQELADGGGAGGESDGVLRGRRLGSTSLPAGVAPGRYYFYLMS